jgi:hypothetical protein
MTTFTNFAVKYFLLTKGAVRLLPHFPPFLQFISCSVICSTISYINLCYSFRLLKYRPVYLYIKWYIFPFSWKSKIYFVGKMNVIQCILIRVFLRFTSAGHKIKVFRYFNERLLKKCSCKLYSYLLDNIFNTIFRANFHQKLRKEQKFERCGRELRKNQT